MEHLMQTLSPSSTHTVQQPNRGLHIALWIVQILVGALFIFAGFTKAFQPAEELAKSIPWTVVVGMPLTRFIGVSQLAGGLGLILPALTRIRPGLTPLAGAGLALVMLLAFGYHVVRSEFQALPMNVVLGGLAAFVAWGRSRKAPILARS
jgi:putative oxidoreductase